MHCEARFEETLGRQQASSARGRLLSIAPGRTRQALFLGTAGPARSGPAHPQALQEAESSRRDSTSRCVAVDQVAASAATCGGSVHAPPRLLEDTNCKSRAGNPPKTGTDLGRRLFSFLR